MRLIIPIVLIALMLPYVTSSDTPAGEWLVPPDPRMNVVLASADATDQPPLRDRAPKTVPATQPAIGFLVRATRDASACR